MSTLTLVGDITIRKPLRALHDREPGILGAAAIATSSDLTIGNLEMPLSRRGYRVPKWSNIRSDPEIIGDVRTLGMEAVSLANNHMMDFGPAAMLDTLETCDAAGIARCGAGPDLEAALSPAMLDAAGLRVALLSVSCTLPMESEAGPDKPGIAPIHVGFSFEVDPNLLAEQPGTMPTVRSWALRDDVDRVSAVISDLRTKSDIVVVAIHWGVPAFWLSPSQGLLAEYQQPLGHALIEAGADVVCGTHSHSLHPIEIYKGRPILYSLGNFLFEEPRDFMRPESLVARLRVDRASALELVPLMIDARGLPYPAGGEASQVLSMIRDMSERFGTSLQVQDDVGVIPLDFAPPLTASSRGSVTPRNHGRRQK